MLLFSIANFSSGIGLSQEGRGREAFVLACQRMFATRPQQTGGKELQLFFRMSV